MISPQNWLLDQNPNAAAVEQLWNQEYPLFHDTIVVLDDDPTGTQTVNQITVYTDWSEATIARAFKSNARMFYILTNSRSFSEAKTEAAHQEIAERLAKVAGQMNREFTLISRGDSTLRGHYPIEDQTLRKGLQQHLGFQLDAEIICPAFFDGGRYTIGDVHYLKQGEHLVPVGQTEFAKDGTFGYQASNLMGYVVEKSHGEINVGDCVSISLQDLRALNISKVTNQLVQCHDFQQVIVNATDITDLRVFSLCFIAARLKGKHFTCRSAADLPRVLGNVHAQLPLKAEQVLDPHNVNGGLIIIGSHVALSTTQLQHLKLAQPQLKYFEFEVSEFNSTHTLVKETQRLLEAVTKVIAAGKTAVVYTSRQVIIPDKSNKEELLALSVAISQGLTQIVAELKIRPRYLIAKGGITSSDVATKGLGIQEARVLGQIAKGIPVWQAQAESHFPGLPYLIFPGNVGTADTLKDIVLELEGQHA